LYHWRDATGHEIDLLLDLGGRLLPIEIKSSETIVPEAIAGLTRWTSLAGNPTRGGALVHAGDRSFELQGVAVRPWYLA
jgi:hypothetical protein